MDITFLGAATTVTGSQFLLETGPKPHLVDCGLFQGEPRGGPNRVPLGTTGRPHAIPLTTPPRPRAACSGRVREGFGDRPGDVGTIEGRLVYGLRAAPGRVLQREARWELRNPEKPRRGCAGPSAARAGVDEADAAGRSTTRRPRAAEAGRGPGPHALPGAHAGPGERLRRAGADPEPSARQPADVAR